HDYSVARILVSIITTHGHTARGTSCLDSKRSSWASISFGRFRSQQSANDRIWRAANIDEHNFERRLAREYFGSSERDLHRGIAFRNTARGTVRTCRRL